MTTDFSAILLAAGEGRRLRPQTLSTPKCLMPINGTPILDLWIEMLVGHKNLTQIIINTCYLAEKVEKHINRHKHRERISISFEPTLLGTAGTIKKLERQIKTEHIFIAHADNLSFFDINTFFSEHLQKPNQCHVTMMTFDPHDPRACGIVCLDKRRIVTSYTEKPKSFLSGEANAAVYFFNRAGLKDIRNMEKVFDLSRDVIPHFVGRIFAWKNTIYHRDIGTPESYKLSQTEFLKFRPKESE